MNIKYIIIIAVIAGIVQFSIPDSKLDVLMKQTNAEYEGGFIKAQAKRGEIFNIHNVAEVGNVTIVEFYTDKCPGCIKLHQHLNKFLNVRFDVVVKQIHMPDNWSVAWAKRKYGLSIGSTPHIYLFDSEGHIVANDEGLDKSGFKLLYEWINAELRNDFSKKEKEVRLDLINPKSNLPPV